MNKKETTKHILSTAFWIVMAIHVVAFTIVGVVSSRWTLLIIFVPSVVLIMAIKRVVITRRKRSREDSQRGKRL